MNRLIEPSASAAILRISRCSYGRHPHQRLPGTLRELAAASRRFDDFVRELARFNERRDR